MGTICGSTRVTLTSDEDVRDVAATFMRDESVIFWSVRIAASQKRKRPVEATSGAATTSECEVEPELQTAGKSGKNKRESGLLIKICRR